MPPPPAAGMWLLLAAEAPLAWLQLIDEPRPEAVPMWLPELLKQGYSVGLLSGDAAAEGRRIAVLLGITDITTDVAPAAKVADVRRRQALGARLLMVGDGINDAAAMASAHTSIAVSPADVVVQEAADATLLTNSLNSLLYIDQLFEAGATDHSAKCRLGYSLQFMRHPSGSGWPVATLDGGSWYVVEFAVSGV